eukprot:4264749-Amphidinium_carterae.1
MVKVPTVTSTHKKKVSCYSGMIDAFVRCRMWLSDRLKVVVFELVAAGTPIRVQLRKFLPRHLLRQNGMQCRCNTRATYSSSGSTSDLLHCGKTPCSTAIDSDSWLFCVFASLQQDRTTCLTDGLQLHRVRAETHYMICKKLRS